MTGARVIQAIQTDLLKRGDGDCHESQVRVVTQFYTPDGRLIAESDVVHNGWVVMFDHIWPKIKGAIETASVEENWKPLIELYRWMEKEADTWQEALVPEGKKIGSDFLLGLEAMRRFIAGDIPRELLATFVSPMGAKLPRIDPEALQ